MTLIIYEQHKATNTQHDTQTYLQSYVAYKSLKWVSDIDVQTEFRKSFITMFLSNGDGIRLVVTKLEVVKCVKYIYVFTTFSSQSPVLTSVSVVRQMALPTCGRETKEHRECHESETSSRRAFLLIQSVYFTPRSSRTRFGW